MYKSFNITKWVLVFLSFSFIISCFSHKIQDSDDSDVSKETVNKSDGMITDTIFYTYYKNNDSCSKWINIPEVDFSNANVNIINNDELLKYYLEGDYSKIDFEKKTLLLIYGAELSMNRPTDFILHKVSENKIILDIKIQASIAAALNYWNKAILINKISDESTIEINICR